MTLATTLIVRPFQESRETRGTWDSSFRVLLVAETSHPASGSYTHTHIYTFISAFSLSLYKIPGASCCVCPVYSSVQLPYKYNVYSIRPDSLTFFRPTSLYSSDSIQHHPLFFIHFFSSPLGFCIFWLGRRRLNYFTKERSFLPAKKKILKSKWEGIPRHFQLRWKFFLLFRHGQTHTHTHREKGGEIYIYINMRDQENVYAIIINPGRIYIVAAAVVRAEITQKVFRSFSPLFFPFQQPQRETRVPLNHPTSHRCNFSRPVNFQLICSLASAQCKKEKKKETSKPKDE